MSNLMGDHDQEHRYRRVSMKRAAGSLNQPVLLELSPALKTEFLREMQADWNDYVGRWNPSGDMHKAQTFNW